jgi:hypothetical protein
MGIAMTIGDWRMVASNTIAIRSVRISVEDLSIRWNSPWYAHTVFGIVKRPGRRSLDLGNVGTAVEVPVRGDTRQAVLIST